MGTIYCDKSGTCLKVRNQRLVYGGVKQKYAIPLKLLSQIIISAEITLDSRSLRELLNAGINLTLINHRKTSETIVLYGSGGDNAVLRLSQYSSVIDDQFCTEIARHVVDLKIKHSEKVLLRWRKRHPRQRLVLTKSLKQIRKARDSLRRTRNRASLRGIEGAASRAFWQAFSTLLPASMPFRKRLKRPPPDPVNALLSLTFTLVHARAVQVCHKRGLDPMLGYLHEPLHGRDSLACDLVEPMRPKITAWVLETLRQKKIRDKDFSRVNAKCWLKKHARQKYFFLFQHEIPSWERYLNSLVSGLKRQLHSRQNENNKNTWTNDNVNTGLEKKGLN